MIICTSDSRQYISDISCEKVGASFIVETCNVRKLKVTGFDGVERDVELFLTPSKFDCRDEQEVMRVVQSLKEQGYKAPEWIFDCLELTKSLHTKLN